MRGPSTLKVPPGAAAVDMVRGGAGRLERPAMGTRCVEARASQRHCQQRHDAGQLSTSLPVVLRLVSQTGRNALTLPGG